MNRAVEQDFACHLSNEQLPCRFHTNSYRPSDSRSGRNGRQNYRTGKSFNLCSDKYMPRFTVWLLLALPLSAGSPVFIGNVANSKDWSVARGIAFTDPSVQRQGRKAMVVQPMETSDAYVKSPVVHLTIGKRYEVSGYVRTESLEVKDTGRSPIATGAALSMASMPWDVHSESIGGNSDWTRLNLRFVATHVDDNIVLKVADGGTFRGKAWFEGVTIDEVSGESAWPAKAALQTYGPAYRYPQGGWIYLHIEGKPYERGYQHGHLMAKEIPRYLERCAADFEPQSKDWKEARTSANAIFLRGFDQEILEEMKGIADGASDAGAKWQDRRIDLIDIVTANTIVEMGELRAALPMTPTGLEALHLQSPQYRNTKRDVPVTERCSAFLATGKATRDGKMVVGHTTWWPLTLAEQTNVMIDIQPPQGHRILMQSYPGGIESGTDWYQNDAGVVLTETTIRQSPFNPEGTPVAYRARKAIQYGDNIDKVVEYLGAKNNGLYTNEWLIADAKTDEIAMFELGTYRTKLWRSSKNEWFGGTEGFYWGCNNAKDLNVRLEYMPDPKGAPEHVPFVPTTRDLKWQQLYRDYKGQIDEQFGFMAFRTAPLVSAAAMDAKVLTSAMASKMMVWAVIGKPNEREWVPSEFQKQSYAKNDGLYSSGYRLVTVAAPAVLRTASLEETSKTAVTAEPSHDAKLAKGQPWKGWVLPATPADLWFSAGSAAYYEDLQSGDMDNAMAAHWALYRSAKMSDPQTEIDRFELELHKGAIMLDALRRGLGDSRFFDLMRDYFAANTTKEVSAQAFLEKAGTTATMPPDNGGPAYLAGGIMHRLQNALIVYGTTTEASANRYTAEQIQTNYLNRFESAIPIRKDFEVSDADLRNHDVIFVGRPETNSAIAGFRARIDLNYDGGNFRIKGKDHASENEALILATTNPLDEKRMFLILAGNSGLETVRLATTRLGKYEYAVLNLGRNEESGFRTAGPPVRSGLSQR